MAIRTMMDSGVEYIYQTEYGKPHSDFYIPEYVLEHQVIANGHIYLTSDGSGCEVKIINSLEDIEKFY